MKVNTGAKDRLEVTLQDYSANRLILLHGLPLLIKGQKSRHAQEWVNVSVTEVAEVFGFRL